jgi:cold shock CspA family protein
MVYTGTVVRFFADRRFGFILYDEGEIFFHELDMLDSTFAPQRGDKISFEIGMYKGRAKAIKITPSGGFNEGR